MPSLANRVAKSSATPMPSLISTAVVQSKTRPWRSASRGVGIQRYS